MTHVFYFNETWDPQDGGCLNILRSSDMADSIAEITPIVGNSSVLVRAQNSWHSVSRVVEGCHTSRRSMNVIFYHPGAVSTMWPPGDHDAAAPLRAAERLIRLAFTAHVRPTCWRTPRRAAADACSATTSSPRSRRMSRTSRRTRPPACRCAASLLAFASRGRERRVVGDAAASAASELRERGRGLRMRLLENSRSAACNRACSLALRKRVAASRQLGRPWLRALPPAARDASSAGEGPFRRRRIEPRSALRCAARAVSRNAGSAIRPRQKVNSSARSRSLRCGR